MNKIKQKIFLLLNFILLSVVYFIGIGFTSILAKIFGKTFLPSESTKNNKTSFIDFEQSNNLEKMY